MEAEVTAPVPTVLVTKVSAGAEAQSQKERYRKGLPQEDPNDASSCLTPCQDDGTYDGNTWTCERD